MHGDDWVTMCWKGNGKYVQCIDGRTLTILIRFDKPINLEVNGNIPKQLYVNLEPIISLNSLLISQKSEVVISTKGCDFISGYFIGLAYNFEKYKRDYFWTNGRYIILDIEKIRYPFRSFKHPEMYLYNEIVNGIARDDKRSFTRFRQSGNVNLKDEMLRIFPWIPDSIKYYRANDTYLYGRIPNDLLGKKK